MERFLLVKNRFGFTLIELVMVLVLLGILSVAAIPKFFDRESFQKRGYYNEVVAAFRYGQKLALAEGCDIRVRSSASGVDLFRRESCDGTSAFNRAVRHPGKSARFSEAPPGSVSLSRATVVFDGMGRARNASSVVADSSITVGGDRTFQIIGETGYIKMP